MPESTLYPSDLVVHKFVQAEIHTYTHCGNKNT